VTPRENARADRTCRRRENTRPANRSTGFTEDVIIIAVREHYFVCTGSRSATGYKIYLNNLLPFPKQTTHAYPQHYFFLCINQILLAILLRRLALLSIIPRVLATLLRLSLVVLVQNLLGDTVEQLFGVDTEQLPCLV